MGAPPWEWSFSSDARFPTAATVDPSVTRHSGNLTLPAATAAVSGLPFLQLSSGARSAALGEAVVALSDPQALYHNPAALPAGERSAAFSHTEWIQEIRPRVRHPLTRRPRTHHLDRHADLAGLRPRIQDRSLHRFAWRFRRIRGRTDRRLRSRLESKYTRVGVAAKLVRQSIYTENASGFAADFGVLHDLADGVKVAVAVRNLGRMGELDRDATDLPEALHAGVSYQRIANLLLAFEARRVGGSTTAHVGAEYQVGGRLLLRGGYQNADSRDVGFGFGVESGIYRINYAFLPFASGLGDSHRLSFVVRQAVDR